MLRRVCCCEIVVATRVRCLKIVVVECLRRAGLCPWLVCPGLLLRLQPCALCACNRADELRSWCCLHGVRVNVLMTNWRNCVLDQVTRGSCCRVVSMLQAHHEAWRAITVYYLSMMPEPSTLVREPTAVATHPCFWRDAGSFSNCQRGVWSSSRVIQSDSPKHCLLCQTLRRCLTCRVW